MFKFILGSLSAFLIFGDFVYQKPVVIERNGSKFQPQKSFMHTEYLALCISIFDNLVSTFDLKIFRDLYTAFRTLYLLYYIVILLSSK